MCIKLVFVKGTIYQRDFMDKVLLHIIMALIQIGSICVIQIIRQVFVGM